MIGGGSSLNRRVARRACPDSMRTSSGSRSTGAIRGNQPSPVGHLNHGPLADTAHHFGRVLLQRSYPYALHHVRQCSTLDYRFLPDSKSREPGGWAAIECHESPVVNGLGRAAETEEGEGSVAATTNNRSPVAVDVSGVLAGTTLTDISSGGSATCVVSSAGHLYCWGAGYAGQLGYGGYNDRTRPVAVATSGALADARVTHIGMGNMAWMVTEQP